MKQDDAKPAEVLKTDGEARALAYAEAEVPTGKDSPTIEVDRVRIVPPSQTPTVKLGDVPKRTGPRAPEQRVKPEPKGPVELPDGLPVTKMQVIEIDPEVLLELERGLIARDEEGAAKTGGEPAADAGAGPSGGRTESPWVKEAAGGELHAAETLSPVRGSGERAKRSGRSGILMAVVIGLAVGVGVIAATLAGRPPAPSAMPSTTAVPTVTATVSSAGAVPSVAVVATVTPAASATSALSASAGVAVGSTAPREPIKLRGRPRDSVDDPYTDPARVSPAAPSVVTTASSAGLPKAPPAVAPKAPATASSARPAPVPTTGRIMGEEE